MKLKSIIPHGLVFRWNQYQNNKKKRNKRLNKLQYLDDNSLSQEEKDWLWSKGFYPLEKRIFGLDSKNVDLYLDERRYKAIHPINGHYSDLIDSKEFISVITDFTTDINVAFNGKEVTYFKGIQNSENIFEYLKKYLDKNNRLVCRPHGKSGGEGFKILELENIDKWIRDISNSNKRYIVTEEIFQHKYAQDLFSESVNPLRIVVMREGETRTPFIVSASQRIGTLYSAPVSNSGAGGISAPVDMETGILSQGLQRVGNFSWHTRHPDSGAQIEGAQIPNWSELIGSIMEEVERLNWLDWGGFDIAITPKGFKIIEINSLPGLHSPQLLNRPLLARPRVRAFFERKGLEM